MVELAKSTFGKVDAIFLNAGLMPNSLLSALETANWNAMVDVNIKGVLNGIAAVLPTFEAQKSGHVIAVSALLRVSKSMLARVSIAALNGQ